MSVSSAQRKSGARDRQRGAFSLPRADAPVAEGNGDEEAADPDRASRAVTSSPHLMSACRSTSLGFQVRGSS
jgi:hypothetical protein